MLECAGKFCSVIILRDVPRCATFVVFSYRTHYVEYLTAKVARANVDPLPIFDLTDCVQELRRRGIPLPERGPWDTDEIYKTMCAEVRFHLELLNRISD